MKKQIIIRPEAEADIQDAFLWYEQQRNGLGNDFLLCVEEALSIIRRNPEMYPRVHKNVYRSLIRRFPYGVFYIIEEDRIVILAVFHAKRNPKQWKDLA